MKNKFTFMKNKFTFLKNKLTFLKTSSLGDHYIAAKTRFINEIYLGKLRLLCIQTLLPGRTVFCAPIISIQIMDHVFVRPVGKWEDNVHCN
jgi:hypothetical protein